ncbi:MAG TPA: hypothetical protein VMF91_27575 [Bryobacteraceae bacterium]|nr:hypothetical protein [Bryobacteraceae bacterium]
MVSTSDAYLDQYAAFRSNIRYNMSSVQMSPKLSPINPVSLLSVSLSAFVASNAWALTVTPLSTTATQAILTYQAPDNEPCQVQVSENKSLSTLVYDVDPALFPGANLDSRPGNLSSGTARVFVVGKRAAEKAADGNYYSRALEAYTPHYFKVTCGSSQYSGAFHTANIPFGATYNDPLAADPNVPGGYAWPTMDINDRARRYIDPQTGALIRPFTIPSDPGSHTTGASGGGSFCDATITTESGQTGNVCIFGAGFWFLNSTTGDVNRLGTPFVYGYRNWPWGLNQEFSSTPHIGSDSNVPGSVVVLASGANADGSQGQLPITLQYQGNYTPFTGNLPLCGSGQSPCEKMTQMIPSTIQDLVASKFPEAKGRGLTVGFISDGKLFVWINHGNQNSYGWVVVYDFAQKQVVAAMNSFSGAGACRWCTMHGFNPSWYNPGWADPTFDPMPGNGAGMGPYTSDIVTGSLGGPKTLSRCPANKTIPGYLKSYAGQTFCSTFTVNHDPILNDGAIPNSKDYQTQQLEVGDFLHIDDEDVRLLQRSGTNGLTWTVLRGWFRDTQSPDLHYVSSHTGKQLSAQCGFAWSYGNAHWNWAADPWQQNPVSMVLEAHPSGHGGQASANTLLRPGYDLWQGSVPALWEAQKPTFTVSENPLFHGVKDAVGDGNSVDVHPGDYQGTWFTDARPDNNFTVSSDGKPHAASVVGGTLYKLTSSAYGGHSGGVQDVLLDPKHSPVMAYCGKHVLEDTSGSSSTINGTTANSYKYCVSKKSGECVSGSQVGDIYVNCPGVQQRYCNYDGIALSRPDLVDICVGNVGAYTFGLVQMGGTRADSTGATSRLISHGFSRYHLQDVFWNQWSMNPDAGNSKPVWSAFDIPYPNGQPDNQIYMVKIPPYVSDNLARNDYLQVPVPAIVPAGASGVTNAVVQFGYGEFGAPNQFHCTSRQEACVEGNQGATDFAYASDKVTGIACASTCTITVPGIADRTMYLQVLYRNSGDAVVASGPVKVVQVEPPFRLAPAR